MKRLLFVLLIMGGFFSSAQAQYGGWTYFLKSGSTISQAVSTDTLQVNNLRVGTSATSGHVLTANSRGVATFQAGGIDSATAVEDAGWTKVSTNVRLHTTTDEVVVGAATPVSSAKFSIDGDANQIQALVQGSISQGSTVPTFQVETSGGADRFVVVEGAMPGSAYVFNSLFIVETDNSYVHTLSSSGGGGSVGIGVVENSSNGCFLNFYNTTTGQGGNNGFELGINDAEEAEIRNWENTSMRFSTNNLQRMKIRTDGSILIGDDLGGGANGSLVFDATDGDQYTQGINTSDQAVFTGAGGGYSFDANILATTGAVIGGGQAIQQALADTTTLNFPDTAASSESDLTVTITGIATTNWALSWNIGAAAMGSNRIYQAWISSANTITVRFRNVNTATNQDPSPAVFSFVATKFVSQ